MSFMIVTVTDSKERVRRRRRRRYEKKKNYKLKSKLNFMWSSKIKVGTEMGRMLFMFS